MPLKTEMEQGLTPIRRRGQRPRALIAAPLLLACGGGLLLFAQPPRPQRVSLPDGSRVRLDAVTYGLERCVSGTPWQRFLRFIAPPPLKNLTGASLYQGDTPGALTFWTIREVTKPFLSYSSLEASPTDEHGGTAPAVPGQGLGDSVERYVCESFPRRGASVRLRLHQRLSQGTEQGDWQYLGELVTPNPDADMHPQFAGIRCPTRVTSPPPRADPSTPPLPEDLAGGRVEVLIDSLVVGVATPPGMWLSHGPGEEYWRLGYSLRQNGRPTTAWTASLASIEEANGNHWKVSAYSGAEDASGMEHLCFPGPVCRDERAVVAHLELRRTQSGTFAPQELWKARAVPIPGRGKSLRTEQRGQVQGVRLELQEVTGPWARRRPPGWSS